MFCSDISPFRLTPKKKKYFQLTIELTEENSDTRSKTSIHIKNTKNIYTLQNKVYAYSRKYFMDFNKMSGIAIEINETSTDCTT